MHRESLVAPIVGVLFAALIVAAAVVYALMPDGHVRDAGRVVGYTAPPAATRPAIDAFFVGDSVTEGIGTVEGVSAGWAAQASSDLAWNAGIDAFGGTGFVAKGAAKASEAFDVPNRYNKLLSAKPSLVVISGGRNDMFEPANEVRVAISDYFDRLQKDLPNTQIVVMGVWHWNTSHDDPNAGSANRVNGYLRAQAKQVGGQFINPPSSLVDDSTEAKLLSSDKFHPSVAGYQWIGQQMARAFVRAGLPRGPQVYQQASVGARYEDANDKYFAATPPIKP